MSLFEIAGIVGIESIIVYLIVMWDRKRRFSSSKELVDQVHKDPYRSSKPFPSKKQMQFTSSKIINLIKLGPLGKSIGSLLLTCASVTGIGIIHDSSFSVGISGGMEVSLGMIALFWLISSIVCATDL